MRRAGVGSAPRLSEVRLVEPRPRTAPHRGVASAESRATPKYLRRGSPFGTAPGAPETKEARELCGPAVPGLGPRPAEAARNGAGERCGMERCGMERCGLELGAVPAGVTLPASPR